MGPHAVFTIAGVAACLGASSCAVADRDPAAIDVVERFDTALAARDGRAPCRLLGRATAVALAGQDGRPCRRAILALELHTRAPTESTRVHVTNAMVELAGPGAIFLSHGPEGWRISAAGCVPAGSKRPYRCELEG